MIDLKSLFDFIQWDDKRQEDPGGRQFESIYFKDVPRIQALSFYEKDFLPALRVLGNLRQKVGKQKRTLWFWREDGVQRLAVTREPENKDVAVRKSRR